MRTLVLVVLAGLLAAGAALFLSNCDPIDPVVEEA
jgi:hypothetical protein